MKKYLMATAIAAVALAFSASAASASPAPPGASASDWHAVTSTCAGGPPCSFTVNSAALETWVGAPFPPGVKAITCNVDLSGTIDANGRVTVTSVNTLAGAGDPGCAIIVINDLPWDGQLCENHPSGDIYLSLFESFTLGGTTVEGSVFPQVNVDGSGNITDFAIHNLVEYDPNSPPAHYLIDNDPALVTAGAATLTVDHNTDCGWDF